MDRHETIAHIRRYLQTEYAAYVLEHFDNRLILTSRTDLMKHIPDMHPSAMEDALVHLQSEGAITDDNGALITFSPKFLFSDTE